MLVSLRLLCLCISVSSCVLESLFFWIRLTHFLHLSSSPLNDRPNSQEERLEKTRQKHLMEEAKQAQVLRAQEAAAREKRRLELEAKEQRQREEDAVRKEREMERTLIHMYVLSPSTVLEKHVYVTSLIPTGGPFSVV